MVKRMRRLEEKVRKMVCVAIVIVVLSVLTFLLYISLPDAEGPQTWIQIYTSVESNDDIWEIKVDRIRLTDPEKSLSSIPHKNLGLRCEFSTLQYPITIPFSDIKDTWCEDYGVIWHDIDGNDELSVNDIIQIKKTNSDEETFLPGDRVSIGGSVRISGLRGEDIIVHSIPIIELPNNESTTYSILMLHQPHESMIHDWHKIRIYDIRG